MQMRQLALKIRLQYSVIVRSLFGHLFPFKERGEG
jgi:hypothetical protein